MYLIVITSDGYRITILNPWNYSSHSVLVQAWFTHKSSRGTCAILLTRGNEGNIGFLFVLLKLLINCYGECILGLLRPSQRLSLMVIARNEAISLTRVIEGIIGFLIVLQLIVRSYCECVLSLATSLQFSLFRYYIFC